MADYGAINEDIHEEFNHDNNQYKVDGKIFGLFLIPQKHKIYFVSLIFCF